MSFTDLDRATALRWLRGVIDRYRDSKKVVVSVPKEIHLIISKNDEVQTQHWRNDDIS